MGSFVQASQFFLQKMNHGYSKQLLNFDVSIVHIHLLMRWANRSYNLMILPPPIGKVPCQWVERFVRRHLLYIVLIYFSNAVSLRYK